MQGKKQSEKRVRGQTLTLPYAPGPRRRHIVYSCMLAPRKTGIQVVTHFKIFLKHACTHAAPPSQRTQTPLWSTCWCRSWWRP